MDKHGYLQVYQLSPTNRDGSVSIGDPNSLGVTTIPTYIKLIIDAKTWGNNHSTLANFGHHQDGTFGSYVSGSNWLELGRFTPPAWGSLHYGHQMGWDNYGLSLGLSNPSGADKNAYVTWSNSADGGDNNLHFQFNNTYHTTRSDVMSLMSGGNVGINNTAPSVRLHVNQATNGTNNGLIARFENANALWSTSPPSSPSGPYYQTGLELKNALGTAGFFMDENGTGTYIGCSYNSNTSPYTHFGDLNLITSNTGGTNDVRMTIDASNGNVGINTATPQDKLEIHDGSVIMDNWLFDTRYAYGNDFLNIAPKVSGSWDFSKAISLEKSTGNFKVASLSGGSTRMVTVNAGGVLGASSFPVNDNLGNHIATTTLNMNSNAISNITTLSTSGNVTIGGSAIVSYSLSALSNLGVAGTTNLQATSANTITPNFNNMYDLGSSSLKWNDLYLSNAVIALGALQGSAVTATGAIQGLNLTATTFAGGGTTSADIDNSGRLIRTLSDRRLKTNIQDLNYGLNELLKLKSVSYNYINTEKYGDSKTIGFIAQDVEEIMPEVVKQSADAYHLRSLNYVEIIPVIVNAIKEQNNLINEQKKTIEIQKQQINELNSKLDCLNPCQSSQPSTQPKRDIISSARLDQNVPNPFGKTTTIAYYIPQGSTPNMLMLTDLNGKQIKNFMISQTGEGSIIIDASELAPGIYNYSLIVNGKETLTKRMVVASY